MSSGAAGITDAAAPLSVEEYDELRALIAAKFGIDYPPHRRDALASRLAGRLAAHSLSSFASYCDRLKALDADAGEWGQLAEAITNSETYFFREPRQFDQAASLLPTMAGGGRPIRVLSAGCSSGEEAFSLAMLLASKAPLAMRFEVHGVDVTPSRLARARTGRYPLRSLRRGGPPPEGVRLERFGAFQGEDWVFASWLRDCVSFHERNLVDPRGLQLGSFDLVFCRNVLIYAPDDRIPGFVGTLEDSLVPGGHLFLGASETLMSGASSLSPVRVGDRFTYVRTGHSRSPGR